MIHTWRGENPPSMESVRLLVSEGRLRGSGRLVVASDPAAGIEAYNASFELGVDKTADSGRLLVRSTTAEEERTVSLSRSEDGVWLVDHGRGDSGAERSDFDGAADIDLAGAVTFNALPIRRLGLHREPGEHELAVVWVTLPDLTVHVVRQTYSTVSIGERESVVRFAQDDFTADITVDSDGVVITYPGISSRV
ncbi:hypothetical protein EV193_101880 [Herbihabitans rhizosphaerae]|uniref:Glycolipid-binding protein n=1 Tax=Herbihabitans rhizosphaerae TaxID=1872711 RepID=A0A4Q7L6U4_9PSEU|nr:putative glycolipid-binding domain-containing protein [Herbihabitans rhizosphaerae]RZS44996.1 hypothetical protein EV193_101880 [Herbihabitans rhizosphaerae]